MKIEIDYFANVKNFLRSKLNRKILFVTNIFDLGRWFELYRKLGHRPLERDGSEKLAILIRFAVSSRCEKCQRYLQEE